VTPYSLENIYHPIEGTCCLLVYPSVLKMEAKRSSNTSANLCETKQRQISKGCVLHRSNQPYKCEQTVLNLCCGRATAQAVSRRPPTADTRFRTRVGPCGICGGQSGTGTGFYPSTSVFPCQFHSIGAPLDVKTKKTNNFHHRVEQ
jgi:hypothetical protein